MKKKSMLFWLMVSCLIMHLLPEFVFTIMGLLFEEVSGQMLIGVKVLITAISLGIFVLGFVLRYPKSEETQKSQIDVLSCILGFGPVVLVYLIYGKLLSQIAPYIQLFMISNPIWLYMFVGGCSLLMVFALSFTLYLWVNQSQKLAIRRPILRYFSRIFLAIPAGLLGLAALVIVPFCMAILNHFWKDAPAIAEQVVVMVASIIMAILANLTILFVEKMGNSAERIQVVGGKNILLRYVPRFVLLAGAIVLYVIPGMQMMNPMGAKRMDHLLNAATVEYTVRLYALDISGATEIANQAVELMDYVKEPYEIKEEDSEEVRARKERKMEANMSEFEEVFDKYEFFRKDGKALALLNQYKMRGYADEELALKALDLAESEKKSFLVQYAASLVASGYTSDEASHYERTAAVIKKAIKLYDQQENVTEEQSYNFKVQMASLLSKIYQDDQVIKILESVINDHSKKEEYELLAFSYERSGKSEEAFELAESYCKKTEDSPYLMHVAALASLKQKDIDGALDYALSLADYTENATEEELKKCDSYLFGLMEYMVLSDNQQYTEFQYAIYESLTEEQLSQIKKSPFFADYLEGLYLTYCNANEETLPIIEEKFTSVLETQPELASVWYARGVAFVNNSGERDYETAITHYKKAAELNPEIPAVWYALAVAYDYTEQYEEAIVACEKALALVPNSDHGNDWYGINYHCTALLKALKDHVQ